MKGDLKRGLVSSLEFASGRGIVSESIRRDVLEWVDDDSQLIEWLCQELGKRDGVLEGDVLKKACDECGVVRCQEVKIPIRF